MKRFKECEDVRCREGVSKVGKSWLPRGEALRENSWMEAIHRHLEWFGVGMSR